MIFDRSNKYYNNLYLETPATASEKIFVSNNVHQAYPAEIKITWDRYNLTSNLNAGVQIALWGYRETKTTPEFEYITTLEVCSINNFCTIIYIYNFIISLRKRYNWKIIGSIHELGLLYH